MIRDLQYTACIDPHQDASKRKTAFAARQARLAFLALFFKPPMAI
jgi:hypothetical protein